MAAEWCRNCQAKIGASETPWVWRDTIVCQACHRRLSVDFPDPVYHDVEVSCPYLHCGYVQTIRYNVRYPLEIHGCKRCCSSFTVRVAFDVAKHRDANKKPGPMPPLVDYPYMTLVE